jgi:transposase
MNLIVLCKRDFDRKSRLLNEPEFPFKVFISVNIHTVALSWSSCEREHSAPAARSMLHLVWDNISDVCDLVTSRLEISISISALARGFGCKRDRIMSGLAHSLESPEMRGRHQELSEDQEREILAWINKRATKSRPITRRDLREHVTAEYDVLTTRGWVNSFISRSIGELCVTKRSPQETQRHEIPRCFVH